MDLAGFPATEQKALLAAGRASCRELLAACHNRAELTEPVVNAIPTVDWEAAEALAGHLDDDPSFMQDAPLRGLVTAHKDLSDTAGMRTTYGSPIFADHFPDVDAPLVAHLRRCGLITVGKTNTPHLQPGARPDTQPVESSAECRGFQRWGRSCPRLRVGIGRRRVRPWRVPAQSGILQRRRRATPHLRVHAA